MLTAIQVVPTPAMNDVLLGGSGSVNINAIN